ncbi:hypothetical protein E4U41_004920 [Claviceps citrina]|nr:hypothetical protein E4U41_004920 [Claviceps citrina]
MPVTNQAALDQPTPLPSPPTPVKPMDPVGEGGGEEANLSDEASLEDQDEAQAALQPAISAAASHLTSAQTPAAEKAAALERLPGAGYFDGAIAEEDDDDADADASPAPPLPHHPPPPPPPPHQPPEQSSRTRPSKGLLESAFGPTRRHRSRSAGQEAFKKLQKAFPSFSGHASFLPSLPASFLSNFTSDHKQPCSGPSKLAQQSTTSSASGAVTRHLTASERLAKHAPLPDTTRSRTSCSSMSRPRPPMLRRVTSDESMLYHSLSRQSSFGDDNKFNDVREMVNIRLMAIKESLPDVPNFKMPSLARLHAASRMPSMSLNGLFSNSSDESTGSRQMPDARREVRSSSSPGVSKTTNTATSAIDRVLDKLTGDLVILGGYRGSVLRSAEPPHQQLWAPVKLGFNMRKANLEVGLEDEDEETMEQRIVPSGMLKHVGPVDISRKLFKKLRSSPNARKGTLRIWDFGYDWRLSPALSSKKLQEFLAKLPANGPGTPPESRGAFVIAHSLGGLITRHAVNHRPELFAGVLYAGVPQRCVNILGPFRNGDAVLFNEKLLTAHVNFSIRTSFLLLPDDGFCFVDKETGEPYAVDFFNADDWARWRLSPCVAPLLPPCNRDRQQRQPQQPQQQQGSYLPLSSLIPNSLLRGKRPMELDIQSSASASASAGSAAAAASAGSQNSRHGVAPLPSPPQSPSSPPSSPGVVTAPDRERYMKYLRRTLVATSKFRSELAHRQELESANAYPPHAVLYGKTIPTVYAAKVAGRDAIAHADAYDDLIFRPGDGVVLAREAMLPEGYAMVRSGRVSTERGHLTMLGDLPAVAAALEALLRGRQKGIGLGKRDSTQPRP